MEKLIPPDGGFARPLPSLTVADVMRIKLHAISIITQTAEVAIAAGNIKTVMTCAKELSRRSSEFQYRLDAIIADAEVFSAVAPIAPTK